GLTTIIIIMVLDKIAEVIVNTAHCKLEEVTPGAELVSLGVDSLKAITVLFELEEAFDIEIPNEVIPSIVTVNDIVEEIDNIRY
ncbi:MAG: acyl carrier protein, partial [Gammaproteobacteria bacterium]